MLNIIIKFNYSVNWKKSKIRQKYTKVRILTIYKNGKIDIEDLQ